MYMSGADSVGARSLLAICSPRQRSDLKESLVCDISVRSKRTRLLRVLWDLWDHVSLVLANTGSCEAIVILCDLIVSLKVWATHNETRVSLTESSHENPCLLGLYATQKHKLAYTTTPPPCSIRCFKQCLARCGSTFCLYPHLPVHRHVHYKIQVNFWVSNRKHI